MYPINLSKPSRSFPSLKAAASSGLALCLAAALAGCAGAPPAVTVGPKVQTVQELMVKLKKGFDEGTLDTPEFYARELGYPLERPETLKVIPPPYTPRREIRFDEGDLKGAVATVGPTVMPDGRKFLIFHSYNAVPDLAGKPCATLPQLQAVWGITAPEKLTHLTSKGQPPPYRGYRYTVTTHGIERIAGFNVRNYDDCVLPTYGVSQHYK